MEKIDLFLHPNHGEYPLVQPHERSGHGVHLKWAKKAAKAAEHRHRKASRERLNLIMLVADRRKMGMIQKVRANPRPGSIRAMIQLLEYVSLNLESLELVGSAYHVFAND
jgi:hypothetical protein